MEERFQMFWYEGRPNWIAEASIRSFVSFSDVEVDVYSYDPDGDPGIDGCVWKDAREILDFEVAESYRKNMKSYSSSSNLFRYRLLYLKGGWYFDTDCILHRRLDSLFDRPMVFGKESPQWCVVGVLRFPAGMDMFQQMYDECVAIPPEKYRWGMAGPKMFHKHVKANGLEHLALPPVYFYPVHFTQIARFKKPLVLDERTFIVHLWNEALRRKGWQEGDLHPTVLSPTETQSVEWC